MAFFRKILNFFHSISISRKIKKQIGIWKNELTFFKEIEVVESILADSELLKEFQRYQNTVSALEKVLTKIQKHNEEISKLRSQFQSVIAEHSIRKILDNIDTYSFAQLNTFNELALKIGKYTIPNDFSGKEEFLRNMRDYGEIVGNYSEIQKQFSLIKEFYAIITCFGDEYIDGRAEKKVLDSARVILDKIKESGDKYYRIPTLDEKLVERHNEQYICEHLHDKCFDDVNGKSLDEEQRRAILCDSISNLTIAGAGSGKTLTICGKVKYLLDTGKAKEKDILLLSYSKASAEDLESKVSNIREGIKVKTFHSLGLEILNRAYGGKRAIEEQFKVYIKKYFSEELLKDQSKISGLLHYFGLYLHENKLPDKAYADVGEMYADLEKADFQTLKNKLQVYNNHNTDNNYRDRKLETIQRETVKSYEELVIANFLYINGIQYQYERAYKFDTSTPEKRQYTPDFYLTDYDIYLEHYGIDENGKTPQYSEEDEKKYIAGIKWKRQIHSIHNTKCIETYSYEFNNQKIFDNLSARLKDAGVELKPLSPEETEQALKAVLSGQDFSSFMNLVSTFISLYKAQYADASGFEYMKQIDYGSDYNNNRKNFFLKICEDVYNYYISGLRAESKIDFDDMILQATTALDFMSDYCYKYVIVDEFQDISQSRARLLQEIIKHGNSKLFAVGDDWQAIYRFAGCDIGIFFNFGEYFEDAKFNYISTTHRNSAELQAIVEPFITANPEQYKKHIRSDKHQNSPVKLKYHHKKDGKLEAFTAVLKDIAKKDSQAEVLVLGRNSHDIDCILGEDVRSVGRSSQLIHTMFPDMKLTYKTVHSSKGLESDFVILISGEDAKNGFPNKMEDDCLLELVLGYKSKFAFAEERRLFYVALTRTRSVVYVLSDISSPSVFVQEIEESVIAEKIGMVEQSSKEVRLCPWCKSGKLVIRKTSESLRPFYGCSHFPYCTYTINDIKAVEINNRCPDCGDFLVVREGRFGKFIGCNNYPRCRFTRDL